MGCDLRTRGTAASSRGLGGCPSLPLPFAFSGSLAFALAFVCGGCQPAANPARRGRGGASDGGGAVTSHNSLDGEPMSVMDLLQIGQNIVLSRGDQAARGCQ